MSPADRTAVLILAAAFAVLVRLVPIVGAAAALGDGGLFLSMIDDVRAGGLGLPETTSYNNLGIPFLYPPLAIWLTAVAGAMTGAETLDLLRWIPLVVSIGCVAAFAWLAAGVMSSGAAAAATLVYALMPSAYGWVIAGGGLTRGVGLLFALLACGVAVRPGRSRRIAVVVGLLLGLSALSHPQTAVFGAIGCVVLSWERPWRPWLARLVTAALVAILVVSPWVAGVISTHGLDAVLAAGHRLEPLTGLLRMLNLHFSGAPFMDIFAVVGVVGLVAAVPRGQGRLVVLLVATWATGSGGGDFIGAVPWALLGGIGSVVLFELARGAMSGLARTPRLVVGGLLAAVVVFVSVIASVGSVADKSSKLQAITGDQIEAMQWLAANAPEDAVIVVATNDVWGDDEMSEWLPALGQVHSLATVQGSEWLGPESFDRQLRAHIDVLECARDVADCYRGIDPDAWIFVPRGSLGGPLSPADCCPALRATLAAAGYEIVYDEAGATIARPRD